MEAFGIGALLRACDLAVATRTTVLGKGSFFCSSWGDGKKLANIYVSLFPCVHVYLG